MNFMIDCLDSGGFFRISFEEVSALLAIPLEEIKTCYETLSGLEPVGIFSRSLPECLLRQLDFLGKRTPVMEYKITWTISPSDTSAPSPEAFISAQQKSESISP